MKARFHIAECNLSYAKLQQKTEIDSIEDKNSKLPMYFQKKAKVAFTFRKQHYTRQPTDYHHIRANKSPQK